MKPVVPREQANRDVDEAVTFYLQDASSAIALDFIDELEGAYTHLSRHPGTGSLRHGYELDLSGLCCWPLSRFPYLVFYVECPDHLDVWRVLHSRCDLAARMRD